MQQIDSLIETLLGNEQIVGACELLFKDKCAELAKLLEREIGTAMSMFKTGPFVTVVSSRFCVFIL